MKRIDLEKHFDKILRNSGLDDPHSDFSNAYKENYDLLIQRNGDKILFSIREVSENLNISYDFVAENIRKGKIKSIKFGDRPMVNVKEHVRIMSEGI